MMKSINRIINPAVKQAIREAEDQSEILISYLQIGLFVMMGILYALAPKGFDGMEVLFQPIPIVMAIYIPIMVLRLVLSYRRMMRGSILYVAIIVDVLIIIALIWSYHLQYGEPASISLQAPTFVALFLSLALRSLRYEPSYILVSIVTILIGWIALVVYAVQTYGEITHDFLDYVVSDKILVGAEVERLINLTAVGLILALGVVRSRRLLAFSQEQNRAVRSMSNFFSPEVAKRIATTQDNFEPGIGEIRSAVMMIVDLRGFTKFSLTNQPNNVMNVLSTYQSRLVPLIRDQGGSIDKFLGDGILIHFGVVDESKEYAANALRTAEAIITNMEQWQKRRQDQSELVFGFGIAATAGQVVFGTVGDASRLEFTVIGRAVNSATKFEEYNKQLKTCFLTTYRTYQIALKQGYKPMYRYKRYNKQLVSGLPDALDLAGIPINPQKINS